MSIIDVSINEGQSLLLEGHPEIQEMVAACVPAGDQLKNPIFMVLDLEHPDLGFRRACRVAAAAWATRVVSSQISRPYYQAAKDLLVLLDQLSQGEDISGNKRKEVPGSEEGGGRSPAGD